MGCHPVSVPFQFSGLLEGPGPPSPSLLYSASFLLEIQCTGAVGAGNKEDFMGVLDVNKPHIHSSFINSPSIYPWLLVARYNQSCGGRVAVARVLGSRERLGLRQTRLPRAEHVKGCMRLPNQKRC